METSETGVYPKESWEAAPAWTTDMSFILPLFPGDVRDSNGRQRGGPEVPAHPLCSTLPRSLVAFHSDDVSRAAASACAAAR